MKISVKGVIVPSEDGWIYDWFGMDYVTPDVVEKSLEDAKTAGEDVDIDINSGGGDVFAGSEIYSAIRAYTGKVNIHVVGLAASAASVIACAAHSDISPTAQFMVHNVSAQASGDYHDMDQSSKILKKANKAIAAAYVDKTGMPEKDALDMMDCETWLTAQEAVDYGLIDEIAGSQNAEIETAGGTQLAASIGGLLPLATVNKLKAQKMSLQLELVKLKGDERHED